VSPRAGPSNIHDLVATGAPDPAHAADLLLDADAARPFDLSADQLIRAIAVQVEPDAWRLQVTFHHIAFDGWSTGVFLNELAAGYRAACLGRRADLPPLQTQVPDVAAWQRAQVDMPKFAADRRYWHERLHDIPALELPLDFEPEPLPRHRAARFERQLPADVHRALLAFSHRHQATLFAVAFAGWAALTSRRCGQTRCLLGVALAGRTNAEWEPLLGNFVNVLPFAVDVDAAPTFAALVAQVRLRSAEALAHQHFPFQGLASEIGSARRSAGDTLFPVIFNYRNLPLDLPDGLPDLSITAFEAPARGPVAPLNINLIPGEDGIRLELDVDPDQIAADTAERWLDAYIALLRAALDDPDGPIARLPIIGLGERSQLARWSRTDRARGWDQMPLRLQLTPSGKVGHNTVQATPDAQPSGSGPAIDSSTDTTLEDALRTIWARLLRVPHVGLDDDFSDLGGHSLLAATMVHELEASTGHRLPITTLFEARTIRRLMPQLLAHANHSDDAGVREIQRGTPEQPPFFMLTGDLTGVGSYCRGLAEAAGPEQPVYAIPPTPPTSNQDLFRIEGMAAMHLRDVKRIQPAGPYRLGGFCIGGLVAYEMARQLEATGNTVDLVLIVDASAPGRFERVTQLLAHAASYFASRDAIGRLDREAYLTHRVGSLAGMPTIEHFVTIAKYPARVALRQWNRGLSAAHLAAGGGENESLYERTTKHHFRAQQLYHPGRYAGRVDLVRTPGPRRSPAAQFVAWRRVAPHVVLHEVAAGHSDVVFKHLPDLLRQQLTRVNDARQSPRQR